MTEKPHPLLPPEIVAALPQMHATKDIEDPMVQVKFFTPWADWSWFVTEFDGEDICFGLVAGFEVELGYFSLAEITALKGPGGIPVERDLHFKPQRLSKVRSEVEQLRGGYGPDHDVVSDRQEEFNHVGAGGLPSPFAAPGVKLIGTSLNNVGRAARFKAIANPSSAAAIIFDVIGDADREHFVSLYLNSRNQITHAHVVSIGTAQASLVHPREVFKAAILANATSMIVGHNHPSGSVRPSQEDKQVLKRLTKASEVIGIKILDSIIVGSDGLFHSSESGGPFPLPDPAGQVGEGGGFIQRGEEKSSCYARICSELMEDIAELIEKRGQEWWDENVSAKSHHIDRAKRALGNSPYRIGPGAELPRIDVEPG